MFKAAYVHRVFLLLNVYLGFQNLVYTLHRGQALGDVIACTREIFQRIDDRIKNNEVVNKCWALHHLIVQNQHSAKPQHDNNHYRTQKLAHGMRQLLANVHLHDVVSVGAVHLVKSRIHLIFGTEGLDNAQSAQRFLHLTHGVAPQRLGLNGVLFKPSAHIPHEPAEQRHENQGEKR